MSSLIDKIVMKQINSAYNELEFAYGLMKDDVELFDEEDVKLIEEALSCIDEYFDKIA